MQDLYDWGVTGVQLHNEGDDAITWCSDGTVRVGKVDPAVIARNPNQKVYVGGGYVVDQSTRVSFNFSCLPIRPIPCTGTAQRLQLIHVLTNNPTSLTSGRAGDFYGGGAFINDKCYKTDTYSRILTHFIQGDVPFTGYFKVPSTGCSADTNYARVLVYSNVDSCTGGGPGAAADVVTGQAISMFMLRCWCSSGGSNMQMDSMHEVTLGTPAVV